MSTTHFAIVRYMTLLAIVLAATSMTVAIQPQRWMHATESDFEGGDTEDAVVTDLGRIKLANQTTSIGEMPEQATAIFDLHEVEGVLYIAAGPSGKLLKRDGEEIVEVIDLPAEQVFAIDEYDGRLLLALSGESSRLATLDGDKLNTIIELDGIRYIWDIIVDDDTIILATGTDGQVIAVEPDELVEPPQENDDIDDDDDDGDDDGDDEADQAEVPPFVQPGVMVLLDSNQTNVLCLDMDVSETIYAGTDTDGLIYRLVETDDDQYESYVIYDADEPEIGDLIVTENGTVYAGTADADQARPGRLDEPQRESTGRPDQDVIITDENEMPMPGDVPGDMEESELPGEHVEDMNGRIDGINNPNGIENHQPPPADPTEQYIRRQVSLSDQTSDAQNDLQNDGNNNDGQSPVEASPPTTEQYDALREVVRSRLDSARKSGVLQAGPGEQSMPLGRQAAVSGPSRARPVGPQRPAKEGNAVYRIDSLGFVSEVFRESVMILGLITLDDKLLITTGNEGQIYSVDLADLETAIVADLKAEQITAMLTNDDGQLLLGTSNPAELIQFDSGLATRGSYTGPVLDASQISLWGTFNLTCRIPTDCSVTVETRSGNVDDPEKAPWSPWSQAQAFMPEDTLPPIPPLQPREMKVLSPPARFLQYRLAFTGTGMVSPQVDVVELAYVTPNMKPRIMSVKASYPDEPDRQGGTISGGMSGGKGRLMTDEPPATVMNVEWEAQDDNGDELIYALEYQPAGSGKWLQIDDDIHQPSFEWQTRHVPDGRYILRVTADDRLNNPGSMAMSAARRSDPVLVDHTPPRLDELKLEVKGNSINITATASDELSPIKSIAYVLDSEEQYTPVLPDDLIYDSTSEPWHVTISNLSPGPVVMTLRVLDLRGNATYKARVIEIK